MVVGWLSVLPVVLWGGIVGSLPPPGDTLTVRGAASAKTPWRAEVTPTRPGWLLLELDLEPQAGKPTVHPDLDLEVGLVPSSTRSSGRVRSQRRRTARYRYTSIFEPVKVLPGEG